MPRFVEEGVNAMSLFSNDRTVIDQASAVDRGKFIVNRAIICYIFIVSRLSFGYERAGVKLP